MRTERVSASLIPVSDQTRGDRREVKTPCSAYNSDAFAHVYKLISFLFVVLRIAYLEGEKQRSLFCSSVSSHVSRKQEGVHCENYDRTPNETR